MKRAAAIAIGVVLFTSAARGQVRVVRSDSARLAAVEAVDVLVTHGNAASPACDVTTRAIGTGAVDTLGAAQVRATISDKARSWFYSLVIELHTRQHGASCATAMSTELVAEVEAVPEADRHAPPGAWGSLFRGYMPLAHEADVVVGPPAGHDADVQRAVAAQVAAVAARVRAAR